jgi:hypothetical protein
MKYLFIVTISIGALVACTPKTTEGMTSGTENNEGNSVTNNEMVEAGQMIFKENCISCHYGRSADNISGLVDSFSKEQWDEILPEMLDNAKLGATQTEKLEKYIYWEITN